MIKANIISRGIILGEPAPKHIGIKNMTIHPATPPSTLLSEGEDGAIKKNRREATIIIITPMKNSKIPIEISLFN